MPNAKPQERLRFRALRSKTRALKKRIAIIFSAIQRLPSGPGLAFRSFAFKKTRRFAFAFLSPLRVHRGHSGTVANANANSDAPRRFASEFRPPNLKEKAANSALRRNSLMNAKVFANEMANVSSSLWKFLANGCMRQNSLAIANATAWCTQSLTIPFSRNSRELLDLGDSRDSPQAKRPHL